jgi:hydrogenase nickel incorporation protein HypA/HybF
MDERELANFVLRAVDDAAYLSSVTRVREVRIAIGGRRAINPEILKRIFSVISRGTVAEGAHLGVTITPVTHHCRRCGGNFTATAADCPCPGCGHPRTELVGGEEIRLLAMEAA